MSSGGASVKKQGAGRVSDKDVASFARELAILVEGGIQIDEALSSIARTETNPKLAQAQSAAARKLASGRSLRDVLSDHRGTFGTLFTDMMISGDGVGRLDEVSQQIADVLDQRVEMQSTVRRALAYPIVVLSFLLLALTVITLFVIPRFAELFESSGVELPLLTRVIRDIADIIFSNWKILSVLAIAGGVAIVWAAKLRLLGPMLQRGLLSVPFFRDLIRGAAAAQFCRVLAISLSAGIDPLSAVRLGVATSGQRFFRQEFDRVAIEMEAGRSLGQALKQQNSLPPFAVRLFSASTSSTELCKTAALTAKHFERLSIARSKSIGTVIEPILTIGLAVIVLLVALSVFLPMWSLVGVGR